MSREISSTRTRGRLFVAVVVAAIGVAAVLALFAGGDGPPASRGLVEIADLRVDGPGIAPYAGGPTSPTGAPRLFGVDQHGQDVAVAFDDGRPTLLLFLAHWCPHCQVELPRVAAWRQAGGGQGLRVVAVSSGQDATRPNWPPSAWIEREGWIDPVLLDDRDGAAARAYGLTAYPFFALVDAEGVLRARASGELSVRELDALAEVVGAPSGARE